MTTGKDQDDDQDTFYVNISEAARLSDLSESQIRYFESHGGIEIGRREGPGRGYRVYTKRDVALLSWVHSLNWQPRKVARHLTEHRAEVLKSLGQVTIDQALMGDEALSGTEMLILCLATIFSQLVSEILKKVDHPHVRYLVVGKPNLDWLRAIQVNFAEGKGSDLKGCLIMCNDVSSAESQGMDPHEPRVLYAHQSLYLPYSAQHQMLTIGCNSIPLPIIVIVQRPLAETQEARSTSVTVLETIGSEATLCRLFYDSLQRIMDSALRNFARIRLLTSSLSTEGLKRGLSVLLEMCIDPYFPDCHAYILPVEGRSHPTAHFGSYITSSAHGEPVDASIALSGTKFPWWIRFTQEHGGIALAQRSANSPFHHWEPRERSVVCLPLTSLGKMLGVLCLEGGSADENRDCLAYRLGIDSLDRLRYLMYMAEVAAYLYTMMATSSERAVKSAQIRAHQETISWYLRIYKQGGLNYEPAVSEMLQRIRLRPDDNLSVVLVDIVDELGLAREFQGFEVVTDLLDKTKKRLISMIHDDRSLRELNEHNHFVLLDEVIGDHLLIAAVNVTKGALRMFTDKVRSLWRRELDDMFEWQGRAIPILLHVGIADFPEIATISESEQQQILAHELRVMAQSMFQIEKKRKGEHKSARLTQQEEAIATYRHLITPYGWSEQELHLS